MYKRIINHVGTTCLLRICICSPLARSNIMTVRWFVLPLLWLPLCGCSSGQQVWVAPPHSSFAYSRGSDGDPPNLAPARQGHHKSHRPQPAERAKSIIEDRSTIKREEAELELLPKYSHEWVVLRTRIDADEDARVAKILVICRGCETASELKAPIIDATFPDPAPRKNAAKEYHIIGWTARLTAPRPRVR